MSVPVTKSEAVRERIIRAIANGEFSHGERLPGEHSLAERFDVSRATVRLALAELQQGGYITTQAGSGSFVTYDGQGIAPAESWSTALAARGVSSTTSIVRFERAHDAALAESLGLPGDDFIVIERLRHADDAAPISLELSRIPYRPELAGLAELAGGADHSAGALEGRSLTGILEDAGLVTDQMEEWAAVLPLEPPAATLLGRHPGESWLSLTSLARDRRGQVIEHIDSWLDPAHFHLHHIYRRPTS
jgi:GntR family transcriptional regulator